MCVCCFGLFCLFTMRPLCTQEWKELRWQYDSNPFPTFQFPSNSNSLSTHLVKAQRQCVFSSSQHLFLLFVHVFQFSFLWCIDAIGYREWMHSVRPMMWLLLLLLLLLPFFSRCLPNRKLFLHILRVEGSVVPFLVYSVALLVCLYVRTHKKKLRRWLFRLQNLVYFWYRAGGSFRFSLCYFVPSFCCRSIWLHRYLMKHKNRVFDYKLQMRTSTFLFYFSFRWFISSAEICQTSRKFFDYTHQETHSHFVQRFGEFISIKKSNWIVIHCNWEWIIRKFQFYRSFFSYEKRNKPQLNLILHVICHFWYMNQWVIMWTIISSIFQ